MAVGPSRGRMAHIGRISSRCGRWATETRRGPFAPVGIQTICVNGRGGLQRHGRVGQAGRTEERNMNKQFAVTHSDDEWRRLLTPEQYEVLRGHGTEAPGSCALNYEKRAGSFACAGCGQ